MASRQLIIAGGIQEAFKTAKERNLRNNQWQFICAVDDIRHARPGSTVWLVGTYYERRDYDELAEFCAARDIGLVRV